MIYDINTPLKLRGPGLLVAARLGNLSNSNPSNNLQIAYLEISNSPPPQASVVLVRHKLSSWPSNEIQLHIRY